MIEKILNNTTPYGKIRASHEGTLHSSTLNDLESPRGLRALACHMLWIGTLSLCLMKA